jgi:hypothetical protein
MPEVESVLIRPVRSSSFLSTIFYPTGHAGSPSLSVSAVNSLEFETDFYVTSHAPVSSEQPTIFDMDSCDIPYIVSCTTIVEIKGIVRAIQESQPLARSDAFDKMLDKAMERQGKPNNIEEWAKSIAGEVLNLTD